MKNLGIRKILVTFYLLILRVLSCIEAPKVRLLSVRLPACLNACK
jgi:hypothetical protein